MVNFLRRFSSFFKVFLSPSVSCIFLWDWEDFKGYEDFISLVEKVRRYFGVISLGELWRDGWVLGKAVLVFLYPRRGFYYQGFWKYLVSQGLPFTILLEDSMVGTGRLAGREERLLYKERGAGWVEEVDGMRAGCGFGDLKALPADLVSFGVHLRGGREWEELKRYFEANLGREVGPWVWAEKGQEVVEGVWYLSSQPGVVERHTSFRSIPTLKRF